MNKTTIAKLFKTIPLFLAGTYLFTVFPGFRKKQEWKNLLGWDYAHRGLHDKSSGIPENSLAAFRRAAEHHYGIELDVRMTKDHHLVILHDDSLMRMCCAPGKVSETPLHELQKLRLAGTEEKIPLFSEVLELIGGKVPLIIEIKNEKNDSEDLCKLVWDQLRRYNGHYCVESFHPGVVRWFRMNHPEIIRGQLSCRPPKNPPVNYFAFLSVTLLLPNFLARPDFIACQCQDIWMPGYWINRHIYREMMVLWTIKSPKEYAYYRKKADLLIFENFTP